MRRALCLLCILLVSVGVSSALAQHEGEIELSRKVIETERQAIIEANMGLTSDEAAAFWPLFREYRHAIAQVGDRSIELIKQYAQNWEDLSDEQGEAMLDEFMDIQKSELAIRRKFVPRFRKILPTKKVTRYFQLENKLDAIIDYDLAEQIPLVR